MIFLINISCSGELKSESTKSQSITTRKDLKSVDKVKTPKTVTTTVAKQTTTESVTSVNNGNLVWESNVPGTVKKSGTSAQTVSLEDLGGKTVYLLLVKD